MKQWRFGWNVGRALERHQPFAPLHDVLNGERFARFAFVEKWNRTEIRKIEHAAESDEQKHMKGC